MIFQYKNIAIHVFVTSQNRKKIFCWYNKSSGSKSVVRKSLFNVNISNIKKHIKNYQKYTVSFIGGGCTVGLVSPRTRFVSINEQVGADDLSPLKERVEKSYRIGVINFSWNFNLWFDVRRASA